MKHSCIIILLAICFTSYAQTKAERVTEVPDFTKFSDVKEKKKAFFNFLRPLVGEANEALTNDHNRIQSLSDKLKSGAKISDIDGAWLKETASYYRVSPFNINSEVNRKALLKKVDLIPESLFLAQAALESSWGTSRFAKSANNIFGQWCFTEGCGIIPSQRKAGETHEVQKFASVNDAVKTYMHHLNSHPFYVKLRDSRLASRRASEAPSGYAMAVGLEKYSARGTAYVKEIRSVISYNKLETLK